MDRSLYNPSALLYITMLPTAPSLLKSIFVLHPSLSLSVSVQWYRAILGRQSKFIIVSYYVIFIRSCDHAQSDVKRKGISPDQEYGDRQFKNTVSPFILFCYIGFSSNGFSCDKHQQYLQEIFPSS